jgi:hypothetical protein
MMQRKRLRAATAGALLSAGLIAATAANVGATSAGKADSSTAYAATTHTVNGVQFIAGEITDKLLGSGAVTYTVKVANVPNKPGTYALTVKPVTTWFSNGSLTGSSHATLKVGAKLSVKVTGTVSETTGAGALAGHSFTGSLMTSQYVFHVVGTYK